MTGRDSRGGGGGGRGWKAVEGRGVRVLSSVLGSDL